MNPDFPDAGLHTQLDLIHQSLAVLLGDLARRDTRNDTPAAQLLARHQAIIAYNATLAAAPSTEEVPSGEAPE